MSGVTVDVTAEESGANAPLSETDTRPEHIPEKFWDAATGQVNVDAMAKSYAELEKAQTAKAPAPSDADEKAPVVPKLDATPADEAKATAAEAGIDYNAVEAEYLEKGEISVETYAKLAASGLPKNVVDSYVAGQQAQATAVAERLHTEVGGKETFDTMIEWASTNLSDDDRGIWNDAVDSGNEAKMALAARHVQSLYTAANGSEPTLMQGDRVGQTQDVFASTAQLSTAMNDPRYQKDPAYRDEVLAKLQRSSIL